MKKAGIVSGLVLVAVSLSGCGEETEMQFEGTKLPVSQIEEIMEDRLEAENGLDLEVTIHEESEE